MVKCKALTGSAVKGLKRVTIVFRFVEIWKREGDEGTRGKGRDWKSGMGRRRREVSVPHLSKGPQVPDDAITPLASVVVGDGDNMINIQLSCDITIPCKG